MALTVTPNLIDISLMNVSAAGWSAGAFDETDPIEGAGCLSLQVKATTSAIIKYTYYTAVATVSRARASNIATLVTATHGLAIGDKITVRLLGGAGYNGNWEVLTVPNATTITYNNTGSNEGTASDTAGRVTKTMNMTDKHLYIWMKVNGTVDTKVNGGFRMYVETDDSNYGTWYVGGKDTPGGWQCYVIDPASTPTTPVGTIIPTHITKIGVQFKTLSSALGGIKNCYWDACRYGSGLTITSGEADAIDFEDIFAVDDDAAKKYGIVTKGLGTYVIQGLLTFGGIGAENVDFVDKSQVIIFPANVFVSDSFYGIKVLAGSGVVNFTLGEKSGTAGILGCLLKAPGTKKFYFDVSDTDIDVMKLYGCNFINAGIITLLPNAANREVLNSAFEICSELIVNTCIMKYCNFISSAGRAIRISSASHNVTECNFINCQTAIHHNVGGTVETPLHIDYDKLMFTGGTYHIENSASTPNFYIDIDRLNGSNPDVAKINNSNGGTTTLLAIGVTLTIKTVNKLNVALNGIRCRIERSDNGTALLNEETANVAGEDGIATESYIYPGSPVDIIIRARKSTSGTRYLPFDTIGKIEGDFKIIVVMYEDSNVT